MVAERRSGSPLAASSAGSWIACSLMARGEVNLEGEEDGAGPVEGGANGHIGRFQNASRISYFYPNAKLS